MLVRIWVFIRYKTQFNAKLKEFNRGAATESIPLNHSAVRSSTNVRNGHALPLGAKAQRALPRRARQGPRVIGLQPRIRLDEIGVADLPQDGGEENVGDRERLAGDPTAAVEPALQRPASLTSVARRSRAPTPPMPPSIIWISNSGRSTSNIYNSKGFVHRCCLTSRLTLSSRTRRPRFDSVQRIFLIRRDTYGALRSNLSECTAHHD
jgi:hypothetical protein